MAEEGRNFLILEINENGKFRIVWSVYNANDVDYVALYENAYQPNEKYLVCKSTGGQSSGIIDTKIYAKPYVQLRYLSYDKKTKKYQAKIYTNVYPDVRANIQEDKRKMYLLQLGIFNGKAAAYYDNGVYGNDAWIGLYPNGTDINNYDGYDDYIWVKKNSNFAVFDKPIKPGYHLRYYHDNGSVLSRDWCLDGYTYPFSEVKAINDYSMERIQISKDIYQLLKPSFPKLSYDDTYITANSTPNYNCIAWSLGFTDRWINPLEDTDKFKLLYKQYGYEETLSSDEAIIDLYCQNGKGTHGARYNEADSMWESKLGPSIRIEHNRYDLTNKYEEEEKTLSAYGDIFAHFKKTIFNESFQQIKRKTLVDECKIKAQSLITKYSQERYLYLEELFQNWKNRWWKGEYAYSSNTRDLQKCKEYKLLAEQEDIDEFVIFKLCEEENFPALHLIENRIDISLDDYLDQQSKAATLVEKYIGNLK